MRCILVVGFLSSITSVAFAQDSLTQDSTAVARHEFEEGVAAFERAEFDVALQHFEMAHAASPHPAVLVNIANCQEALGRNAEALANYDRFLRESENVAPAQRREVNAAITRLHAASATPSATPVMAQVQIQVELARSDMGPAVIMIDGQNLTPDSAGMYALAPGAHDVQVAAPGHVSESRHFETRANEPLQLALALHETSTLADPFAAAPTTENNGGTRFEVRPYTWVFAGLTGALLLSGIVTGVLALNANADFETSITESNRSDQTQVQRLRATENGHGYAQTTRDFAVATDVLLVTGGLSAATFLVLLLSTSQTSTTENERQRTGLRWQLSPGGASAVAHF